MNKFDELSPGELPKGALRKITYDYIVHDMGRGEITVKYNISDYSYHVIVRRCDLVKKREQYRKMVLQKSLEKLADKQSQAICDSVEVMLSHVGSVKEIQRSGILPSEIINDVMKIYTVMTKEKRLDEDRPTSNLGITVKVIMPEMPHLGQKKPTIDVTQPKPAEPPKPDTQPSAEAPKQEVSVKVDEGIVSVL